MKIRFIRDALFENEGRNKGQQFRAGEIYDLDDAFAQRWLNRGVAVRLDPADDPTAAKPQALNKAEIDRAAKAKADAAAKQDQEDAKAAKEAAQKAAPASELAAPEPASQARPASSIGGGAQMLPGATKA